MENDEGFREKLKESKRRQEKLKEKIKKLRSKVEEQKEEKNKIAKKKNNTIAEKEEKIEKLEERLELEERLDKSNSDTDRKLKEENRDLKEELEDLYDEKEELNKKIKDLREGTNDVVLKSEEELMLNPNVDLKGGIRTEDKLSIEENSKISDSISAEDDIELKPEVTVEGNVVSDQGCVQIDDECKIKGQVKGEEIQLGEGVEAGTLKSFGDVGIKGDSITDDVYALGDIELGDEVKIKGDVEYGGELNIGVKVTVTDSLMPKSEEEIKETFDVDEEDQKAEREEEEEIEEPSKEEKEDVNTVPKEAEKIDFEHYLSSLNMEDEIIDQSRNILQKIGSDKVTIKTLKDEIDGYEQNEIDQLIERMCDEDILVKESQEEEVKVKLNDRED